MHYGHPQQKQIVGCVPIGVGLVAASLTGEALAPARTKTAAARAKPQPSRPFRPDCLTPIQLASDGQDLHGLYVLLILDVPLDDGQGCPTHGRSEVTVV